MDDKYQVASFLTIGNWREYLIEAWGLGMFMVAAGVVVTVLESPEYPGVEMIPNAFIRRAIVGIAMGLTAIAIIYSPWGKRSGAHINPAVTITFFRLGKIKLQDALGYILAQFIGGWLGVLLVVFLFGEAFTTPPVNYVVTVPGSGGWLIASIAEFILSFTLMLMVLIVSNSTKIATFTGIFSGILVATFITFEAPLSGMSINPARTFASALPASIWTDFWLYYFIPPLAMLSAAELYLRQFSKQKVICSKLCPNSDTPCIAIKCCQHE